MDGYVRMHDDLCTAPDDNPTIGLILCTEKNETVARYSSRSRGFTSAEWERFAAALRHYAKHHPISRIKTTPFATNYSSDCNLPTPDQRNPCIRRVWEIRPDDARPRLITAHPLG